MPRQGIRPVKGGLNPGRAARAILANLRGIRPVAVAREPERASDTRQKIKNQQKVAERTCVRRATRYSVRHKRSL
jgi:hypothetical protein